MKRILLVLVLLVVLIGAAVFFLMPRGAIEGAQLISADSVLYVAAPDVQRTINRWPKTSLAQISMEPAVADFLRRPLDQLSTGGGLEAMDLIFRVKPGRLFLAVTGVRQNGADVMLGFQFFGDRKDLDAGMERLYREAGKMVPNSTRTTADYKGDTVTTFSGSTPMIFSASHGSWGFIANSQAALEQSLDRAAGRLTSDSLADSADFKKVLTQVSFDPDLFWYGRPAPIFDLLLELGKQQNAAINSKQLEQMKKLQALGGTLLLDGPNQKETSFILYPDAPKLDTINRGPMALTTPETSFFYDATLDLKTIASDDYHASLPPEAQTFLANAKIDLKQLPEIFGNDLGFIMSWPASAMIPTVLLAIEVKDHARAESFLASLVSNFGLQPTQSELNGVQVLGFPVPQVPLVEPSLAVNDKFLLASITTAELGRALSVQPGMPTLESAETFKSALSIYKDSGQAFGYVDSKALFERVYNMLRPIAILAAMSGSANKMFDVQKLPETEAISRHLSPILYSCHQKADGFLIESSGPITLSQAAMLIGTGAAASYVGYMAR